ncbi:MAG: hypothetical protein ABF295_01400, partial [Flavobacteriaceae bacterium]
DPDDPDNNDDPDDPDTTGTVVFEENFILEEERRLVTYVLSDTEYNKFLDGDGDLQMVTGKVYEYLEDNFDFIFILSVEESQPVGLYYGRSTKVKNDVQGIGSSIYDGTSAYGSAGNLKSVIHMPRTEYVVNGPFLHEIVHYWANRDFIPTTVGGHWGYSSAGGQLGGFDELIDLGNDTYQGRLNGSNSFGPNANGGNTLPYSNVELYTMGLIGPGELESIQVAENPQSNGQQGQFTADAITIYTATDLLVQHGDRIPTVQNSQKDFRSLAVVISRAELSEEKITSVNRDLENFARQAAPDSYWGNAYNFWEATGERASLEIGVVSSDIK